MAESIPSYPRMPHYKTPEHVDTVLPAKTVEIYRRVAQEANKYPEILEKTIGSSRIQVMPFLSAENQVGEGQVRVQIYPPTAAEMLRIITRRLEEEEKNHHESLTPLITKAYLHS